MVVSEGDCVGVIASRMGPYEVVQLLASTFH